MKTIDIKDVDIFAAGTWNGDKYTEENIQQMVDGFAATKDRLKPYLKLGHDDKQAILQEDGLPAAGWIDNVRKVGKKLVADFKRVPEKIANLIKEGAYRRVSSEIFIDMNLEDKKYPTLLKAVALMGGETPAVQTLDDIMALYKDKCEVKEYDNKTEYKKYEINLTEIIKEDIMSEELKKQNEDLTTKLAASEKKFTESQEANKVLKTEKDVKDAEVKKFEQEKIDVEITSMVEKFIEDKHILPVDKDTVQSLVTKLYSDEEGMKSFKAYVEKQEVDLKTKPKSELGKKPDANDLDNSGLMEKAKQYSEEKKVSYKEALLIVRKQK